MSESLDKPDYKGRKYRPWHYEFQGARHYKKPEAEGKEHGGFSEEAEGDAVPYTDDVEDRQLYSMVPQCGSYQNGCDFLVSDEIEEDEVERNEKDRLSAYLKNKHNLNSKGGEKPANSYSIELNHQQEIDRNNSICLVPTSGNNNKLVPTERWAEDYNLTPCPVNYNKSYPYKSYRPYPNVSHEEEINEYENQKGIPQIHTATSGLFSSYPADPGKRYTPHSAKDRMNLPPYSRGEECPNRPHSSTDRVTFQTAPTHEGQVYQTVSRAERIPYLPYPQMERVRPLVSHKYI